MALFKKQMQDILTEKEAKLAALNQKSESAVQLVRSTIDGLAVVDEQITATIAEITDIQHRISSTKNGLEERQRKNQQIMHNFKSLLCEE